VPPARCQTNAPDDDAASKTLSNHRVIPA